MIVQSTPPPTTAALGTGEKTSVKGVMNNQEKMYSGLENQQRCGIWGGGSQWRGGIGGGTTVSLNEQVE